MISPILEHISQTLNYGDLPETWRVPEIGYFSAQKTLYDYQHDTLRNAARALYLYYGKEENDYQTAEPKGANDRRKQNFARQYGSSSIDQFSVKKYESRADRQNQRQNPVFRILSEFITPQGEAIPYTQLINRMCFWLATGSGKTLVMVKLIEHLHRLREPGEIPNHNLLVLAPSDHLIGQIHRTVEEFNQSGLYINLIPLRDSGKTIQRRLGDYATVYYHRSDNISDVQKEALIDYRRYENGGKWYVLLDEAHKGGKEDSKRQAYYAVMAREGFLFNFSATFTDPEDIVTSVKKYNLEEFIKNGHGKNIYLNEIQYDAFINREVEISHDERRKIVLKSLITLAYVSLRVVEIREYTGMNNLYHLPLMLTLVNSVNTDVENERNDLWAFFQTLREIATGEIDESLFQTSKEELAHEWTSTLLLFGGDSGGIIGTGATTIKGMKIADLREKIFSSRGKSALQLIRSKDNKELAFQMKNADAPFALIRIGDTSKWRNNLLAGFDETRTLEEKSFFDGLEKSSITILMGSRSFFESWDSNRPNVINFINIGGTDAKKFVVQSVGRGVRIETLPNQRRRCAFLPDSSEKSALQNFHDKVQPAETLFLFATNRGAIKSVLEGLQAERSDVFENITGFVQSPRPKINGQEMLLLVPEYRESKDRVTGQTEFALSNNTLNRFKKWLRHTSSSVLAVRDNLSSQELKALHGIADGQNVQIRAEKNYACLPFLQSRLTSHLSQTNQIADTVRELDEQEDIVHFRQIRVQLDQAERKDLREKIRAVAKGGISATEKKKRARQFADGKIVSEEYERYLSGKSEETFKSLKLKHVPEHYYVPLVVAEHGKTDFIQHIIREPSEVRFFHCLEKWLETNKTEWDAWMFSKIDESLDKIFIPYYDTSTNEYARFFPDFIFWMCKENDYQIVFVDPKGTEHKSAYLKIDGYQKLFEENGKRREFQYQKSRVSVTLWMFNKEDTVPDAYQRFWTNSPADIFAFALTRRVK